MTEASAVLDLGWLSSTSSPAPGLRTPGLGSDGEDGWTLQLWSAVGPEDWRGPTAAHSPYREHAQGLLI